MRDTDKPIAWLAILPNGELYSIRMSEDELRRDMVNYDWPDTLKVTPAYTHPTSGCNKPCDYFCVYTPKEPT